MQRSTRLEERHTLERFELLLGAPLSHYQNGTFTHQEVQSLPSLFNFSTGQLRKWSLFVMNCHDPRFLSHFVILYYDLRLGVAVLNGTVNFYTPEYINMYSEVISDS